MKKLMMLMVTAFAAMMPLMANAETVVVTFDANGGVAEYWDEWGGYYADSEMFLSVTKGTAISTLPNAWYENDAHFFTGWFDANGNEFTEDTIVTNDMTVTARWIEDDGSFKMLVSRGTVMRYFGTCPAELTAANWPEGVTAIGASAFRSASQLESVFIPAGVTSIGDGAFADCCSVTNAVIPASIEAIDGYAFAWCYVLSSVTFVGGEEYIADLSDYAFWETPYERSRPFSMIVDGNGIVTGCHGTCPATLATADWPEGVTAIGASAFRSASQLESVLVPAGVTNIGHRAFASCYSLTNAVIPASVEAIYDYAFADCSSLTMVNFLGAETDVDIAPTAFIRTPYDATKSFGLIVEENGTLVGFHGVAPANVVISNYLEDVDLTGIGKAALSAWYYNNTASMTNVVVPEGVTWIGESAFASDEALESVTLPMSLQSISYNAFQGCTALRELRIPSGVEYVDYTLFEGCTNLTVHAPETLNGMFSVPEEDGCRIVYYEVPQYTVTFNANGGTVDGGATSNCLIYAGRRLGVEGYDEWGNWGRWLPTPMLNGYEFLGWFTAAEDGTQVTAETVVTGAMTLYAHWVKICDVTFDANGGVAEYWDEWGAYYTDSEMSLSVTKGTAISTLPNAWYEDDDHFFTGWFDANGNEFTEDTIVTNDMTVTARWIVDDGTFKMLVTRGVVTGYFGTCPAELTAADWPEGVTAIGSYAFSNASQLESVSIPAGVTNIGHQAFSWCYSLTNAVIPASVEAIDDYAFGWCSSLSSVTFSGGEENIADLSDYAFWNTPYDRSRPFSMIVDENEIVTGYHGTCPASLAAADWPEGVTAIGSYAFNGAALTSVAIPSTVTAIGDYAFLWCSYLSSVTFDGDVSQIDIADGAFDRTPWAQDNMPTVLIRCDEYGNEAENGTTLGGYHGASPVTLDLPEWVTAIAYGAFGYCNALQEIMVPTNVTEIGYSAFENCYNLSRAFLPKALEGVIDESSVFSGSPVTVYYYEGDAPTLVTITLNANGGSVDTTTVHAVPNNVIGILPEPALNGYVFLGWFTAAEGGDEVTAYTVVTGAMTLYAHWEEITYTYNCIDNGDGTVTLSAYSEYGGLSNSPISPTPVGDFTVPSEIDGKRVVAIGDRFFKNCSDMTSVTIPASVTNLTGGAFIIEGNGYGNLTNITVAADNPAYKEIDGILYTKDGKTLVACPCAKSGDIVVAAETEYIGEYAFYHTSVRSVELQEGVKTIGDYAFYGLNWNFASVTIPASVRSICAYAFGRCNWLETVNFHGVEDNVDIAVSAFYFTPYNACRPFALIIEDGVLRGIQGSAPENLDIAQWLDGQHLNNIDQYALSAIYSDTLSMTNVVVPEGVFTIDYAAFAGNTALENITLPMSLQSIGYAAFQDCTSLRTITIPPGVTYMYDSYWVPGYFDGCQNLTVYAPETLRGLFSVPDTCTIEYYAVPQHTVTFNTNGGMFYDGATTFEWTVNERSSLGMSPPDPVWTSADVEFNGWYTAAEGGEQVTAETIVNDDMTLYAHWVAVTPEWYWNVHEEDGNGCPQSVVIEGYSVDFAGELVIPSSIDVEYDGGVVAVPVGEIADGAFPGYSFTSVTIPACVTNIGDWAFETCCNLTNVIFVGGMEGIAMKPTSVFYGTPWLEAYVATLPVPDNDDFAKAAEISGESGSVTGTNIGAGVEDGEPLPLERVEDVLFNSTATVWWRWRAPASGTFVFTTQGSDFSAALGVYTGNSVDALVKIDAYRSEWLDGAATSAAVTFHAIMGTTYYIAVGGYRDYIGGIVLSWDKSPFTFGGNAPWRYVADDILRSGDISDGQTSSAEMFVVGPASVSFKWKISSNWGDRLRFAIDADYVSEISGSMPDWVERTYTIESGEHALRWVYSQGYTYYYSGSGCGLIKDVVVTPLSVNDVIIEAGENIVQDNGDGSYVITPPLGGELTAADVEAIAVKTRLNGEWVYTTAGYDIVFGGGVITVSLKKAEVDCAVDATLKDLDDKSGFLVDPSRVTVAGAPDLSVGETLGALPVRAVPGLWYQASWGADLGAMTEGVKVQATSGALYLGVSRQDGTSGFYGIKVTDK